MATVTVYRSGSRNLRKGGGALFPAFPFLLLFLSPPLSPFPLEVGLLKPAMGLGERCKLPKRGPWQSLSRNEFGAL